MKKKLRTDICSNYMLKRRKYRFGNKHKRYVKECFKKKQKGSLMHEIGMGKIIIIIVCGIIILAGSFLDGSGSKNSSSDDVEQYIRQ